MTTLVYENFGDVGQPEPFTDENGNGAYDAGEAFTDVNGNGGWDEDMGAAGLGGPGDVVVYQMSYDWSIIIPMFRPFFGDTITCRPTSPSATSRSSEPELAESSPMAIAFGSSRPAAVRPRPARNRGGSRAWPRLLRCAAGNVAVEFALSVPVILMMMLGSAEMARFVILHQKMDRVATTISDLVSRAETITESQIADIFTAAGQVAEPFDLAGLGVVIVSSVTNADGTGAVDRLAAQRRRLLLRPSASSASRATSPTCRTASRCARARPRSSPRCSTTSRRSSAS